VGLRALRASILDADDHLSLHDPPPIAPKLNEKDLHDIPIPLEMLLPKEHLFVPLRIEFGIPATPPNLEWFLNSDGLITEDSLPRKEELDRMPGRSVTFKILKGVDQSGNAVEVEHTIPKDLLEGKPDFSLLAKREYYLGSSVDPTAIVLRLANDRQVNHPLRRLDPNNLIVSGGFEKGSCPILFAVSDGETQRLGPVLRDAVTRGAEMTELRSVPAAEFYRLAEEEAETSYIKSVALRLERPGRSPLILQPRELRTLWPKEGSYVTLSRGQAYRS
jgi:hypothetical protein